MSTTDRPTGSKYFKLYQKLTLVEIFRLVYGCNEFDGLLVFTENVLTSTNFFLFKCIYSFFGQTNEYFA